MQAKHCGFILGSLAYFVFANNHVEAGPASRRLAREIYPEVEPENDANQSQVCIVGDVVYGVDETVPAEQPCLKCKCQPPGVQCEATRCPTKKPGCRAVHRPNQCCPDYQCECDYNGRKYSNGERLETLPGNECKVCYCRGGEIQCTDVSCYVRNDCEGKQVPGQCCPKYEHCPTRDSMEKLLTNISSNVSPLFNSVPGVDSPVQTSSNEPTLNDDPDNPQNQDNGIQSEVNTIQQTNSMQSPKITIQEIIPDVKEIPITPKPTPDENVKAEGELVIEEAKSVPFEEESNDLIATDSDAESSELTEVIQNPPPVIRIGDSLLFLKRNELVNEKDASSTPASIITLVGAEGLQRGGLDEVVENITTTDGLTSISDKPSSTNSEDYNNDLTPASSSHILSLVKKKKKPATVAQIALAPSTTSLPIITTSMDYSSDIPVYTKNATEDTTQSILSVTSLDSMEPSTTYQPEVSSPEINAKETTITPTVSNTTNVSSFKDHPRILELEVEQDPAYPTQTDPDEGWMKIQTNENLNETISSEKPYRKESKILQEILEVRNNKTVPVNVTHTEWLKSGVTSNNKDFIPLINLRAALPPEILNAPAENDESIDEEVDDDPDEIIATSTVQLEETAVTTETPLNTSVEIISSEIDNGQVGNYTELDSAEGSKSVETMESSVEYSGEKTTPKGNPSAPLVSEENASVEDDKKDSEVNDMLFVKEYTIDLSNDQENKKSIEKESSENSTSDPKNMDVEMINIAELEKNRTEVSEKLPTPEKLVTPDKTIDKRESTPESEDDAIFTQLNQELGLGTTENPKTPEEEDIESRRIFQELLEETSTPKSQKNLQGRTKETEALERVSQALAKLALGGSQPLDTGVLSVLGDFFRSQYRAYDSKSP